MLSNPLSRTLDISFADWVDRLPESEIRRLLRFNPKYYFGGGKPGSLPIKIFHDIISEMLADERSLLSQKSEQVLDSYNYGKTEGNDEFRAVLAKRLQQRDGVNCTADDVVITTGSQQMLYALNDVLINPGDLILTTRPTYLGFLMPAEKLGATIITLPSDINGLLPEYIDSAIDSCQKEFGRVPKMLYVVPYSDNPKGTTLPERRKKQVIDTVFSRNDLLLVEDAAYKEIQFDSNSYHPLKKYDTDNEFIAYLSTTTKEAASLRAGYSVLPRKLREAVVKGKGYYDLCTSEWVQRILTKYYEKHIDDQLPAICSDYKSRRDAMVKAVEDYLPEGIFTRPTGGFFVWYETRKQDFDSKKFIAKAIESGVSYVPGDAFFPTRGYAITEDSELIRLKVPTNTMRLGYSLLPPWLITEGIELLGELLDQEVMA
ncbi:MAG: PLP-dependent aminotransferase family protein [Candidatus Odinarchaeota archaeon]